MEEIKKERRSWLGFLTKFLFCLTAFVFVILTILANMGGNGDFHKSSVEQFASEITGFPAKLKTLHGINYFPSISVDLEDLDIMPDLTSEMAIGHVDRAQISLGFWDVLIQNGKMKVLDIQGLYTLPGLFLNKTIALKHLSIVDDGAEKAKLEGQGTIDNVSLLFWMDMKIEGSDRSKKYHFEPRRNVNIELGDIKITAVLQNGFNPYLSIQDLKITKAGNDVVTGRIDISDRRRREMTIEGDVTLVQNGTVLKPDLIFDKQAHALWGTITSENFSEKDFDTGSYFDEVVKALIIILGDPKTDAMLLDGYFAAQKVELDLKGEKTYQGPLKFKDNHLSLQ